ncbi:MAG: hypothetical protein GY800_10515 [Planctomycetes bacterium]|nr:hypothetical protein [Planctomycetota bacterium]
MSLLGTNNRTMLVPALVAAVCIGALGSAAYENIRNPLFGYFSEWSIRITTLGRGDMVDAMYQDIGMGFSQNYSISSFYSLHETVFAAFLATIIIASKILMPEEMKLIGITDTAKRAEVLNKHLRRFVRALTLLIIAFLVFFQVNRSYSEYKNNAIVHVNQAITICAPAISEKEVEGLYSDFSSIRTRADYVALDDKLKAIAKANDLYFPEFRVY